MIMKVGILGGGQLGRMLLQAAANYVVETYVLENDENCPAAHLCTHFIKGDIKDFDTVYNFGKMVDAVTIEIEAVNVEALEKLEAEGIKIFPKPAALKIIRNKILQKEWYKDNSIPSPAFVVTNKATDINNQLQFLPAVHKLAEGGYDGKGVQIINDKSEAGKAFDAPSILEKMVNLQKEIAIIIAMNEKGETAIYPPVEMVFNPLLNLLDYQIAPARITKDILWKAEAIAIKVVKNFKSAGLFAIEMFVNKNNDVYVNETAPRVHNSGHHTIEASYCSQYDMLWRVILNYPLGNTANITCSTIVNIIGTSGYNGEAKYEGLEEVLKIDGAFVHLYGKTITKPGRKMGHITILCTDIADINYKANRVKQLLQVKA